MTTIRQPRPNNYTNLCSLYQSNKENQPKTKNQITKYIISLYLSNRLKEYTNIKGFLGLGEIAGMIGVKESYLVKVMNKELESNQELIGLGLKMETRACANGLFYKALEDRQLAESLTQILLEKALKARYPAPMFQQTNTAFANQMAANEKILNTLTKLPALLGYGAQPHNNGPNIQILNQNNGLDRPSTESHFLTTEMAIGLLKDQGLKHISPEALYITEGLADIPEVTANVTDAQGRNNLNPKDLIYTTHEDRRQEELGIIEPE